MGQSTYNIDGTSAYRPVYVDDIMIMGIRSRCREKLNRHAYSQCSITNQAINTYKEPAVIKNICGCEVTINFRPNSECSADIKDDVLWLLLQAFMDRKQTKLSTELKKYQKQYDKLNEEIANTLIGESFYSPEQLSAAMTAVQQKIDAINQQLEKIYNEMEQKKASVEKVRPMYEMFKGWAEEFRLATVEQKKMIISQLISRIEIGKGYKINITLNIEYEQFCEGWNSLKNSVQ